MSRRKNTKAFALGVKAGEIRRFSLTRIDRAKALIAEIALKWDDVDSGVAFDADLAIQELDRLAGGIEGGVELLNAPFDDGLPS